MNHPRVWIKFGTQRVSVAQAALRIGISQTGLWDRLRRGVPRDQLFLPGHGPRVKLVPAPTVEPPNPRRNFIAAMNGELTGEEYLAAEHALDKY